jgi:hypothetical protein
MRFEAASGATVTMTGDITFAKTTGIALRFALISDSFLSTPIGLSCWPAHYI